MSQGKHKLPSAPKAGTSVRRRLLVAFEQAAKVDDAGQQYWLARELAPVLGYKQWRNFEAVIDRAKAACGAEGGVIGDHFADVRKVITAGKGAQQVLDDYECSRRACYLIAMNGDPRKKEEIARCGGREARSLHEHVVAPQPPYKLD